MNDKCPDPCAQFDSEPFVQDMQDMRVWIPGVDDIERMPVPMQVEQVQQSWGVFFMHGNDPIGWEVFGVN